MPKSIVIGRLVSVTIVVGSIAYCKYQEHVMNRKIDKMETKIANDKRRLREDMRNLGKN